MTNFREGFSWVVRWKPNKSPPVVGGCRDKCPESGSPLLFRYTGNSPSGNCIHFATGFIAGFLNLVNSGINYQAQLVLPRFQPDSRFGMIQMHQASNDFATKYPAYLVYIYIGKIITTTNPYLIPKGSRDQPKTPAFSC